ncbi:uncharacterized protein sb:cb1058 [Esox lucius]|uniref:uncharacterized protein sb:cb1058 n=1 Tax=Esox lucius TaxID=8010 RepID=UPI0014774EE0|nr:uncharacterized protein sb:cb1058 [Esox lucius]
MTIGKSSRKGSIRAPNFLDKTSGFYGRLDEPETVVGGEGGNRMTGMREGDLGGSCPATEVYTGAEAHQGEHGVFDFNLGMMEEDNTTLLRRKSSRLSSRLRRSIRKTLPQTVSSSFDISTEMETDTPVLEVTAVKVKSHWRSSNRKKQQTESQKVSPREVDLTLGEERGILTLGLEVLEVEIKVETEEGQREEEEGMLDTQEPTDDQVLIKDKKRGKQEETEEKRKIKEQEEKKKRSTLKNYRKAFDRAFRRGWENFITNLYSVTLAPVSPSSALLSSSATSKGTQCDSVLEEDRVICKDQNLYSMTAKPVLYSSSS